MSAIACCASAGNRGDYASTVPFSKIEAWPSQARSVVDSPVPAAAYRYAARHLADCDCASSRRVSALPIVMLDADRFASTVAPDQGPGLFLVPRSAYQIVDTWYASGLKGTGSKDIVMEPTFVPSYRFLSYATLETGHCPGRILHDRPSYRLPVFAILPFTVASPLIGIAQGAVDAYEERLRERIERAGNSLPGMASFAARLAEATAEVGCARLLMRHDLDEMLGRAARDEPLSTEARLRYRRDHCYVAALSVRAVNRLFEASGGHAILESSPLQRAHRDVHAGSHHVILTWDGPAEQYGRVRLGLEPEGAVL